MKRRWSNVSSDGGKGSAEPYLVGFVRRGGMFYPIYITKRDENELLSQIEAVFGTGGLKRVYNK